MILPFHRCELVTLFDLEQVDKIKETLSANNIEYQVKTVDRASPSMFSMGSRERSGSMFQNMGQNWRYIIYVKRSELSKAQECTGGTSIK